MDPQGTVWISGERKIRLIDFGCEEKRKLFPKEDGDGPLLKEIEKLASAILEKKCPSAKIWVLANEEVHPLNFFFGASVLRACGMGEETFLVQLTRVLTNLAQRARKKLRLSYVLFEDKKVKSEELKKEQKDPMGTLKDFFYEWTGLDKDKIPVGIHFSFNFDGHTNSKSISFVILPLGAWRDQVVKTPAQKMATWIKLVLNEVGKPEAMEEKITEIKRAIKGENSIKSLSQSLLGKATMRSLVIVPRGNMLPFVKYLTNMFLCLPCGVFEPVNPIHLEDTGQEAPAAKEQPDLQPHQDCQEVKTRKRDSKQKKEKKEVIEETPTNPIVYPTLSVRVADLSDQRDQQPILSADSLDTPEVIENNKLPNRPIPNAEAVMRNSPRGPETGFVTVKTTEISSRLPVADINKSTTIPHPIREEQEEKRDDNKNAWVGRWDKPNRPPNPITSPTNRGPKVQPLDHDDSSSSDGYDERDTQASDEESQDLLIPDPQQPKPPHVLIEDVHKSDTAEERKHESQIVKFVELFSLFTNATGIDLSVAVSDPVCESEMETMETAATDCNENGPQIPETKYTLSCEEVESLKEIFGVVERLEQQAEHYRQVILEKNRETLELGSALKTLRNEHGEIRCQLSAESSRKKELEEEKRDLETRLEDQETTINKLREELRTAQMVISKLPDFGLEVDHYGEISRIGLMPDVPKPPVTVDTYPEDERISEEKVEEEMVPDPCLEKIKEISVLTDMRRTPNEIKRFKKECHSYKIQAYGIDTARSAIDWLKEHDGKYGLAVYVKIQDQEGRNKFSRWVARRVREGIPRWPIIIQPDEIREQLEYLTSLHRH